jgi:putative (di)nucleoside polyphosphate hydrolase
MEYKLNVAAILQNAAGKILIGERVNVPGAWQFPQGGVDSGETLEQALARELMEEISVPPSSYQVLRRSGPHRYLFSNGRSKRGFDGKEQFYFLARYEGRPDEVDPDTEKPEFRAIRWIAPEDFQIDWLPEMKRLVYQAVLKDFFNLDPAAA